LIALAFIYDAVLSAYHVGVEWHWWPGPDACTGVGSIASSPADLVKSLQSGGNVAVRCDEAPLHIFGLSLAAYGALLSAFLAMLAGTAALGFNPVGWLLARLGLGGSR
jgi:disulfide bond formation protein DsbB